MLLERQGKQGRLVPKEQQASLAVLVYRVLMVQQVAQVVKDLQGVLVPQVRPVIPGALDPKEALEVLAVKVYLAVQVQQGV